MFKNLIVAIALILSILFISPASSVASDFFYSSKDHAIYIHGDIESNDNMTLASMSRQNPDAKTIIITSNGGEWTAGLAMAIFIKEHSFTVDARNYCISSCAYMWLAAAKRISSVDVPTMEFPYIQIHMPYNAWTGGEPPTEISEQAAWIIGFSGVNKAGVEAVESAKYPLLYVIDPDHDPEHWGLAKVPFNDLRPKNKKHGPH